MRALVLALAACEAPHALAGVDALPPAACTATYSGNISEIATSAAACTMVSGGRFTARPPSQRLDAPLAISIELGAATAGHWTSATVATWSASGVRTAAHQACTYSAGNDVSPHGDFALALDGGHGTLSIDTYVLADAFADCGDPTTQTVVLAF